MALFRVRRAQSGRADMLSEQEIETPPVKPEDKHQASNGAGAQPAEIITEGQPGEEPNGEACPATPTFAKAAVFANAVAEGKAVNAEDIFLWKHGVAVEPWPEPVDGKALLDDLMSVIVLYVLLPKWAADQTVQAPRPEGGEQNGESAEQRTDPTRLVRFSCWCPKAIATIKHLPETLADRCIVIGMQRKHPRERCERLRNLQGTELRRK